MTDAPSPAPRVRLPLDAQLDKLRRILMRQKAEYRRLLKAGANMDATKCLESEAELDDIWRTFKWSVSNADWIKAEAMRREIRAEQERQLADLEADPAIAAVTGAFPGATVTNVIPHQPEAAHA